MRRGAVAVAVALALGGLAIGSAPAAAASILEPVEGTGTATIDPKGGANAARSSALAKARRAALDAALGNVAGPLDPDAKKAVQKSADAWTGAYRILDQTDDGSKITVRVEVDIDVVRLTKRVAKPAVKTDAAKFSIGTITLGDPCKAAGDGEWIRSELVALGAVADAGTQALAIDLSCRVLGPVRYTHMHTSSVRAQAKAGTGTVATVEVHGFAADDAEAIRTGLRLALDDLATRLRARGAGRVSIRIESPSPSARVRRFEDALRNSVSGVDDVSIVALEPDVVRLSVAGELTARTLAKRLEALKLPGFSLSITAIAEPDVITIRLR